MSLRYSIIIPAFNEERAIERAVLETQRVFAGFGEPFEIIVVDDGSRDATVSILGELAEKVPELVLVRHEKNRGKGAAVKTGVEKSQGEIFLFLDADLATHPLEFEKCIPLFAENDIVIGSRHIKGSEIVESQSFHRAIAGRVFNSAIRAYLGLPFADTQCGFKAFRSSTKFLFADMTTSGWVFDVELLGRAIKNDLRVVEIPIAWRNGRDSRVKLADAGNIIKELRAVKRRLKD